jgi:hypothetical protein
MKTLTKRFVMLAAGVLMFGAAATTVSAAPRFVAGARVFGGPRVVVVPHVGFRTWGYDPYWAPWYPYPYAYGYTVPIDRSGNAALRTDVTPKQAEVFVDGYYAGHASDFDGAFGHLNVVPGGHQVTLHMDGFRTLTEDVYVRPDSTFKMNATMERLRRGETSAAVPAPTPAPATPPTE